MIIVQQHLEVNGNIIDTLENSESFKFKVKVTGTSPANGNTKDIQIAVSLKYLCSFWKTLEITFINCEVNLILTCSSTCVITNLTGRGNICNN